MSEQFQKEPFDAPFANISRQSPSLPAWLANRLLRPDEEITWVQGPRFSPSWERYVTHPALFLLAVGLGAIIWGITWLLVDPQPEVLVAAALAAGGIVLASIFVLGISCGYFTRLVVTSSRLLIVQGYEVCRSWRVDDLPRHLVRHVKWGGGAESLAVDLEAIKTMLSTSSDKFADAKSILAFGKQLQQIKTREKDHPDQ